MAGTSLAAFRSTVCLRAAPLPGPAPAAIRNPDHADDLRADGAEPVVCDLEHASVDEAPRAESSRVSRRAIFPCPPAITMAALIPVLCAVALLSRLPSQH